MEEEKGRREGEKRREEEKGRREGKNPSHKYPKSYPTLISFISPNAKLLAFLYKF